jgi:2-dehydro-3-deoxyphosphogluconate aldolase/(4S)-4-hydroxy-2-oxoglutarate aldolase
MTEQASATLDRLSRVGIVPVIVLDHAAHAQALVAALAEGGVGAVEITFRTDAGEAAIRAVSDNPDFTVGAGTVLTPSDVDRAADAGATFVVSPGLDESVLERAADLGIATLPGVATATEVQRAVRLGLDAVKLFPVKQLGGVGMVAALAGPFPSVRIMPSGGITVDDAAVYLAQPTVFAISGGWIASRAAIADGDFVGIESRARAAASLRASL